MTEPTGSPIPTHAGWILFTLILGSSLAFLDLTVVHVALPFVQEDLDATATGVQWVIQAYTLVLASLILVGGSLGDRLGRWRMYLVGVTLFAVASLMAGIAPNLGTLVSARALQGVGGALLIPGSLAIISALWTGDARGRAIGTWAGFTSITMAVGPPLGGYLVEQLSWRAAFLINLPIAALVIAAGMKSVPETRDRDSTGRIDWMGATLVTLTLGGAVYGFTRAAASGWTDRLTVASLAGAVVALAAFLAVERRVRAPMVELSLFRSSTFSGANLLTLLLYGGLTVVLYYLPFNLVQVQGYSATAAGAALLPFALIMFAGSRWAGGLIGQFGARLPLTLGAGIVGVAFLLFAVPGIGGPYWTDVFPAMVMLGVGMVIVVAPLTTTVMNAVDDRYSGLASGINNAVSRAGGALALAVLGIVMLGVFAASLGDSLDDLGLDQDQRGRIEATRDQLAGMPVPPGIDEGQAIALGAAIEAAFIDGYRVVMIVCAVIAFASAAIAALTVGAREPIACDTPRPCPAAQPGT
jgi:EmrB/QacA subfamily drug resistance transporter